MFVCVYVCVHAYICLCVCLYLSECVCLSVCLVCLSVCVSQCMCLCVHLCMHVCLCMCVCVCMSVSVSVCVCVETEGERKEGNARESTPEAVCLEQGRRCQGQCTVGKWLCARLIFTVARGRNHDVNLEQQAKEVGWAHPKADTNNGWNSSLQLGEFTIYHNCKCSRMFPFALDI